MGQLIVVRHGQASLMKADYDELSERGRGQATALGQFLGAQGWRFDAAFCGPRRRHRDTATLTADAVRAGDHPWPDLVEVPEIDEHDAFELVQAAGSQLGDDPEIGPGYAALQAAKTMAERSAGFQRVFEAIMRRWMTGRFDPEGVETWPAFRERVRAGLETILASGARRAIAFSSVGPLAVMLQRALGTDAPTSFRTAWRIRNASLSTFVFDRTGRFTLDSFNALPHLPEPGAWTFR